MASGGCCACGSGSALDLQRQFAAAPPEQNGAILDGRDIGTVVLPDADIKFFRCKYNTCAERRTKELLGQTIGYVSRCFARFAKTR